MEHLQCHLTGSSPKCSGFLQLGGSLASRVRQEVQAESDTAREEPFALIPTKNLHFEASENVYHSGTCEYINSAFWFVVAGFVCLFLEVARNVLASAP